MAIRNDIVWTVGADGAVSPTTPQDGGVQGEHNATRAVWQVGEGSVWENPNYKVYVECDDAGGNVDTTEPLAVEGGQISILLPLAWTQYGGMVTLRLVAEEQDGTVAYTAEGLVRFDSRQNASKKVDGLMKGRLAKMEAEMQEAVETAETAAQSAEQAAQSATASAQEAAVQREGAQYFASQAEQAAQSAEQAAQSATALAQEAAVQREGAQYFASQAEQAAQSAEQAAQSATASAQEAAVQREGAQYFASQAEQAAQSAEQAAESAAASQEAVEEIIPRVEALEEKTSLLVVFTISDDGATATADKTWQECIGAYHKGVMVCCETVLGEVTYLGIATYGGGDEEMGILTYSLWDDTNTSVIRIAMYEDGSCEVTTESDADVIVNRVGEYGATKLATEKYVRGKIFNQGLRIDGVEENVASNAKKLSNQRIINARDYGAVGDGVTDDTDAIQTALYVAEASGLPVYIPAGNYLVSKTITTHTRDTEEGAAAQSKYINIYGSGMSTVFTTSADFEGDFVFYIDPKAVQPLMVWVHDFAIDLTVDVSGIYLRFLGMKSVVENLWIDFKYLKQETDTTVRSGIYCDTSVVSTFQRIKIMGNISGLDGKRPMNCGITVRDMTTTKFIDCDIIFCGWALYFGGGSIVVVENCRIDENDYGVFQYTSVNTIGDDPRAYTVSPVTGEAFNGSFKGLTISKNRFEANNKTSIFLISYGGGDMNYMFNNNVAITDNYFTGLGAGTAKWQPDREVFRKAMLFGRCEGVSVERNTFHGAAYDSTMSDSRYQNITLATWLYDLTLRDNVAIAHPVGTDENDETIVVKTNTKLDYNILSNCCFIDDIEANQSTRQEIAVRRSNPITVNASGEVDVSKSNVFALGDGVSVTSLIVESTADLSSNQEVTFIATGTTATITNTGRIRLAGGVDFVMGEFDTITLVRCYVYPRGNFWVEKSRSVNRATTEE